MTWFLRPALRRRLLLVLLSCLTLLGTVRAQQEPPAFDAATPLLERLTPTPASMLAVFREAGMNPRPHALTAKERADVQAAIRRLPPLHQRVLARHLAGVSFLDDMPNTALTGVLNPGDSVRRYHIAFRAGMLRQTVSEWLTEKERTCYAATLTDTTVTVQAGQLPAIVYVLLHESTHVVDGALGLFADPRRPFARAFTQDVWTGRTALLTPDSLLLHNRFRRGGRAYPVGQAPALYRTLRRTPLVSLYSTSSWSEDLAECLTVYHLTRQLHQPFELRVTTPRRTVFRRAPADNPRVRRRMKCLALFYTT